MSNKKFSKQHEWVSVEGDVATIGITKHAAEMLGDVVFVELPEKGKNVKKSILKTPLDGARISSNFGMRKHPISGFNKMHKGTDFAAPMGTPIMASGSGTIKKAGWCGGGGNCVVIRHNSTYETIYAHMKAFAKGIKEGKKVKQGQIIGYVGSTGLSTGPHLHYEVIENEKKNNRKVKYIFSTCFYNWDYDSILLF